LATMAAAGQVLCFDVASRRGSSARPPCPGNPSMAGENGTMLISPPISDGKVDDALRE